MTFDVKKHLIKVQGGRQYLPVAARLVWFRDEHPDWGIETRPVAIDTEKQYAIFEAFVYNAEGKLMAKGTKMENVRGFPDYIEKSETGSIGRALAVCGYGTQFAPDLDETTAGRVVDSPQRSRGSEYGDPYERSRPAGTPANDVSRYGQAKRQEEPTWQPPAGAAPAEQGDEAQGEAPTGCSACGKALNNAQITLSTRKYGEALCPDCQKEWKAVEAAGT